VDPASLTAMTEQIWNTMIVRAWRDRDGLKIRFMAVNANLSSHSMAVEATVEAAARRFDEWLLSVDTSSTQPPFPVASHAEQRKYTRRNDEGATSEETTDL
jgi:hypothetical protein